MAIVVLQFSQLQLAVLRFEVKGLGGQVLISVPSVFGTNGRRSRGGYYQSPDTSKGATLAGLHPKNLSVSI